LKQIGLGLMMYVQDYDERMPMKTSTAPNWRIAIYPYVKSTQVFACPSNPNNGKTATTFVDGGATVKIPISYGANEQTGNQIGSGSITPSPFSVPLDGYLAPTIAMFDSPAQLLIVTESKGTWDNLATAGCSTADPSASGAPENAFFAGHFDMFNVLFADGHVKSMKPTATATPINMWAVNEQNGPGPAALQTCMQRIETAYH
jgi:prepilin-type processing-associated H-X9-DG protein